MAEERSVSVWEGFKIGFGFALGFPLGVAFWTLLTWLVLAILGVNLTHFDMEKLRPR